MKFDAWNFLNGIKDLETGGGRMADGVTIRDDAGFAKDMNYSLRDVSNDSQLTNAVTQTFIIPIQLKGLVNAAVWKVNVPFAATVTAADFRTGVVVSTGSKAATLTVTTNGGGAVTGGVMALTSANQNATGGTVAATAISGAGATIAANQTIEVTVSSVTTFAEGDGYVEFTVTNLDMLAALKGTASETNLRVLSSPASSTTIGEFNVVIPRDYDELTDTFTIHAGLAMAGSTDTPGFTATAYRKRPGSNIATVAASVTGKTRAGATVAGSTTEQVVLFDFSKNSLLMDDSLTIVLTSAAHTTDAVLLYYVQPVYRSTLVAYHESTGGTRDGKDGTFLR